MKPAVNINQNWFSNHFLEKTTLILISKDKEKKSGAVCLQALQLGMVKEAERGSGEKIQNLKKHMLYLATNKQIGIAGA